jgi:hypothetical protein
LLRKGRGLQAGDLDSRLGPLMRELAGGGDAAARRQALTAEITRYSAQLLADYRIAVMVSLGLSTETMQMPYFGERASWLAHHIDRDYRTALRRLGQPTDATTQHAGVGGLHDLMGAPGGHRAADTRSQPPVVSAAQGTMVRSIERRRNCVRGQCCPSVTETHLHHG